MSNILKEATDLLLELSDLPLFGTENIKELLKIDNTSIWWWMDDFILFSDSFANNMENVLNNEPDKKIPFKSKAMHQFFKYRFQLRKRYGSYLKRTDNKKPKILILGGQSRGEGDPVTYPIIEGLKKDYNVLSVDVPSLYSRDTGIKLIKKKIKEKNGFNHALFEDYMPKDINDEIKLDLFLLRRLYFKYKNKISIIHKGIPVWKKIKPQFDAYFKYRLPTHLLYYFTLKNMIDKEKPVLVFYPTETGFLGRMLCAICEDENIPVVLKQHGVMFYSTETVHNSKDFPRPAKVCVWGKKYKDLLVNQGKYPKDSVVITGNMGYDNWNFTKKPISNRILLWAPSLKKDQNKELREIYNITEKLNMELKIKCHPGLPIKFKNLPKNIEVFCKENPNDIIYDADIVLINYCGGFGLEAMMLDKPVILLNPEKQTFSRAISGGDFIGKKVAYVIDNLKETESMIHKIYKDGDVLRSNREEYVKDDCYKFDGGATNRIIKVIKDETIN